MGHTMNYYVGNSYVPTQVFLITIICTKNQQTVELILMYF